MVKYKMKTKIADGTIEEIILDGYALLGEDGKVLPSQLPTQKAKKIYEVVSALPTSGQKNNVIYLLPNSQVSPSTDGTVNNYKEYLWVNNTWENIGSTEVKIDKATILNLLGLQDVELQTLIALAKKITVSDTEINVNADVSANHFNAK